MPVMFVAFHTIVLAETTGAVAFKHKERGRDVNATKNTANGTAIMTLRTAVRKHWWAELAS